MMLTNEPIHYDCPYPQTYHCVLTHKESSCLGMFQDYANCIFISDKQIPGTIDISSPWDSARYGELPAWSWIAQNFRPQDYVALNHYRRKLSLGMGNVIPEPIQMGGNLADQLAYYHSPVLADAIMKTLTPVEQSIFTSSNLLYAYNIACLNVGMVQDLYLPYITNKIMLLESVLGRNYVPDASFFVPREGKDVRPWYQNRVYAFALERYSTLFWLQNPQLINTVGRINLLEEGQRI